MHQLSDEDMMFFELAFLFKMPLYKLMNEMPYDEYVAWVEFLQRRPPGQAEDYRTAVLLSAFAPKAQVATLFPSLRKDDTPHRNMAKKLEGSAFLQHMMNSTGGIKLELQ